jgi:hypothetical protein
VSRRKQAKKESVDQTQFESHAWLVRHGERAVAGRLDLYGDRIRFRRPDGRHPCMFDMPLAEVTAVNSPLSCLGSWLELETADKHYRISFVPPDGGLPNGVRNDGAVIMSLVWDTAHAVRGCWIGMRWLRVLDM